MTTTKEQEDLVREEKVKTEKETYLLSYLSNNIRHELGRSAKS